MHRTTTLTIVASAGLASAAALMLAAPALAGADVTRAAGQVQPMLAGVNNPLVPWGASAKVGYVATADGRTRATLHLTGFAPGHTYGAHAHVGDCAVEGGGHYQQVPVSQGGAVDAANEIWLDVTTDESGNGHSSAVQDWQIRPGTEPRSVIIHALPTITTGDDVGKAGPKLACLQVER